MAKLDMLIKSVENRQPISFQYNRADKTKGVRIGNVHAIFIFTSKKGEISTKLHIVQTDGVSDSGDKGDFPFWRTFNIDFISDVKILEDLDRFEIEEGYNPESYDNPIAKI
tara:strand:- start:167 stop:499 length:333 start_codon:yes stop_codon:yes gene_type:complete